MEEIGKYLLSLLVKQCTAVEEDKVWEQLEVPGAMTG